MAPLTYQLIMKAGPTPGRVTVLDKNEIYIGRDIGNDLIINDAEISRRHARLVAQAGGFMLEDLGSTNGTYVNGQRLAGPYLLQPHDTLTFGENVSLTFEVAQYDPDATMAAAPPPAAAPYAMQPPLRETYVPPSRPAEPAYVGQIPPAQPEASAPADILRNPWLWAGCGCLLILACIVVGAVLWYIDANFLWCNFFPFLPGC